MKSLLITMLLALSNSAQAQKPEVLLGYFFDEEGIVLQVTSGGCTHKDDFYVEKKMSNQMPTLTFYRKHNDTCLALFPHGIFIPFTYEELGLDFKNKFKIQNSTDSSH